MPAPESLKQDILTECEEDHVGLWSIIRDVEEWPNRVAIWSRGLSLPPTGPWLLLLNGH